MTALLTTTGKLVAQNRRQDLAVDRLTEAVKLYVTKVTRQSLDRRTGGAPWRSISFSIQPRACRDIIDKNLMELAGRKSKPPAAVFARGRIRARGLSTGACSTSLTLGLGVFILRRRQERAPS